jgi:glycosyltransferase involved in cell wall biosynthesis
VGRSLRVALLSYRADPHCGGQGVYVHYLSRALARLGHEVEVFAGPPYPELAPEVALTKVPSLDLYRSGDAFRTPRLHEFRGPTDVLEYGLMCAATFPEPLTFSLRAAQLLGARRREFDVVHDNQSLGYGLLALRKMGLPVVATIHHPVSVDRDIDLKHARGKRRLALRRWYSFCRMQARVARRLDRLITVSESGRSDTLDHFEEDPARVGVVPNGVDSDLFRPVPELARRRGHLITTASADVPLKGLVYLIEAVAKLRTERDVTLTVIGKRNGNSAARSAIERYDLQDAVQFKSGVGWLELVELYARAEVAVVPSLYEGFSLPAVEAMACGVPLVATRAGAIPEVTGPDGHASLLVPPGDAEALASRLRTLLDDSGLRERMGAAGRSRALSRFSWIAAAEATVRHYEELLAC